ncbi:hypothetical protein ACFL2V_01095 [Pseudomonadota bacterium]
MLQFRKSWLWMLIAVLVVGLFLTVNFERTPSSAKTESNASTSLVKAAPIDTSALPTLGLPLGQASSSSHHALRNQNDSSGPESNAVTSVPAIPVDSTDNPTTVQQKHDSLPFSERPAVIAMQFYKAAEYPGVSPGATPRPVPIEKIIEKRRRLANGEVLFTRDIKNKSEFDSHSRFSASQP